jgi:hypothetical protein
MGVNADHAKARYFTLANDMTISRFLKSIDRASYRMERCTVRTKPKWEFPPLCRGGSKSLT